MNASPSQSFPKSARLLKRADFLRVYEHGRRHFGPHMTIFYLDSSTNRHPRIGFTVSRALGKSVERNRIRRRVREAVRLNYAALTRPADVVINPKRSAGEADFPVLVAEVAKGFGVIARSAK